MSPLALALILLAALFHATWNVLAKRVPEGGPPFVWLFASLSLVIYSPFVIGVFVIQRPTFSLIDLVFIAGSSLLHIGYFLFLQQAYRVGDLSLVYPLARGTGPTLATIAAIAFLGERPGPVALAGAFLIGISIFVLGRSQSPEASDGNRAALLFGFTTGVFIASYTLWDKYAVSTLVISPIVLDWGANVGRSLVLTPVALNNRDRVRTIWQNHRREALGVAILSPLAYILVLTAMAFTPVSYVAPAREISVVIGTAMGARLLQEGEGLRRIVAASAVVVGVVALAVG